jgi:hypothetical protein
MPPAGFEHAVLASERPQTHALDRAATGTGVCVCVCVCTHRRIQYTLSQVRKYLLVKLWGVPC